MIRRKMENKRMQATIENKSDVNIHGLKPGGTLLVDVDSEGTPLNKEWRRRVADAKTDNAVTLTTTKKKQGGK